MSFLPFIAVCALRAQLVARTPTPLGLVFSSPHGEILNDDNFRHRTFAPAVRRRGLGAVRFHDLRHTYATVLRELDRLIDPPGLEL